MEHEKLKMSYTWNKPVKYNRTGHRRIEVTKCGKRC